MPISDELKKIYANTNTAQRYVECVSLTHPNFGQEFHLTNDFRSWTFLDVANKPITFSPLPFTVSLPSQDGLGLNELDFSFANAGGLMMAALENARVNSQVPISVIYHVYRDIPNDVPQINPPYSMEITEVAVSETSLNARATRFNVLGRIFPRIKYSVVDFPGLKR